MTHIAFVMDPLESLNLKKDSTLAMISAAQKKGWQISYMEQKDLAWKDGEALGYIKNIELDEKFANALDSSAAPREWYKLGKEIAIPLGSIDIIMMRKDPPFDMDYIYTTYLLERAEIDGAFVVNRPGSLRDCNEKFFATKYPQFQPPLVVSQRQDILREFHSKHDDVIYKCLDGMGGARIFRAKEKEPNLNVIIETLTENGRHPIMAQKYIPEIVDGDKRILIIDGKPIDYALARIPMSGETRGNLAAGGTGEGRKLTTRDRLIAETIGPDLVDRGLIFVGIDVIGDFLTEINITCPTCIRELDNHFDINIADDLLSNLEKRFTKP